MAVGLYLMYVRWRRYRNWFKLEHEYSVPVDAESAHPIYRQLMGLEFPFLVKTALEFGLFKTYGIPSISRLLVKTKELTDNVSRRYDDTDLLVREFTENAPNSHRARTAIQRLNYLHSLYPTITNDEYLYVLTVFIVEPITWISKFGWRQPHQKEKISSYLIWKDIGIKMGIKSIPDSFEAAELFLAKYEADNMGYAPANAELAESSARLFLSVVPSFMHPLGKCIIRALCGERLRQALGYSQPPMIVQHFAEYTLSAISLFVKLFKLPRTKCLLRTPEHPAGSEDFPRMCPVFDVFDRNYSPAGYRIDELGPERYAKGRTLCPLGGAPS